MESHESCKLDLERASEKACRLFVEICEKLETRKVDPGIDFNALVEVFRESLKGEGVGLLEALIASEMAASGDAWFATVRFGGKTWLRFNLLNLYTNRDHIRFLIERVTETARRLAGRES